MKKYKFKYSIYLLPTILIFILISIIYYNNYNNTIDIIRSEYSSKANLIEETIYNETKYTEIISEIIDKELHKYMEENSKLFVEKYKRDPDILGWNFREIKNEENMDIYIIDKNLEVIASSIDEEIGLDLDSYTDLSEKLRKRLEGNSFESDKLNFSIKNGELKKYAYMPTSDNKYLIELSVNIKDLYPEFENLNVVYLSEELKNRYDFVEDINVCKINEYKECLHELNRANTSHIEDRSFEIDRDKYIKKVLEENSPHEKIVRKNDDYLYRLKYIPYTVNYEEDQIAWENSYVIEILYDDKNIIKKLALQKTNYLQSMAVVSILYFAFTFIIIDLIGENRKKADKDHLTKLPNRKRFEEIMGYKILGAKNKNGKIAILFFDLDKFKNINDTYGHDFGDKVLQEVGSKIKHELRKEDTVSRLGGDEFTASISGFDSLEEIIEVIERISNSFERGLNIDSKEIYIRPSIGISIYPDHGNTVEELINKADTAMYLAKKKGTRYNIYRKEDHKKNY